MSKYIHSKSSSLDSEPNNPRSREERGKRLRKKSNHKSVEMIYGEHYPTRGGSLGVSYTKATGEISKQHRADSVE